MLFKDCWQTEGRTTTVSDHKSSPWAFSSGELKMYLQGMCRKRRPRSDYICAVWSGPLLSAARITGYYRMYPLRAIAPTFLHIPQLPQAKIYLQGICRKRRPRSDCICAVWAGPLLSAARITRYYRMYPLRAIAPTFFHIPHPRQAKIYLQGMCRKRRPRSDYICAVWSGPLLSAARITGYYRMYPLRAIAPTFLHIPQLRQAKIYLQGMCRKRRPRSDYICAVWSGPLLSAARITGYYRMYPWRATALMRLSMCRMMWFGKTLYMLKGNFLFDAVHVVIAMNKGSYILTL